MNSQFSLKDYLNYTISGILWMTILLYLLFKLNIISSDMIFSIILKADSNIFGFTIVFFGGYLMGNILRFTDCATRYLNKLLFGDPYSYALQPDKVNAKKSKKLGLIGNWCNSKNYSIGKKKSVEIIEKLKYLDLKLDNNKDQYILLECFLGQTIENKKANRMNELKNFYDSISAPVFAILILLLCEITVSNVDFIHKIIICILILMIWYNFMDRYRFLYSNYIKETYRNLLFIK